MGFPLWFGGSDNKSSDGRGGRGGRGGSGGHKGAPRVNSPPQLRLLDHEAPASVNLTVTDAAIIAKVRAGNESAFEQLFRAHYEQLYHFASIYLNDPAAAEDIVIGVFGWLWMNRASWAPRTSAEAYLYGAVRN